MVEQLTAIDVSPRDLVAFLLGAVTVFFAAFVSSAWSWLKKRLNPPAPRPTLVSIRSFSVPGVDPASCVWVPDHQVVDFEARGFTKVLHPASRGPCYGRASREEAWQYLMRQPAEKS